VWVGERQVHADGPGPIAALEKLDRPIDDFLARLAARAVLQVAEIRVMVELGLDIECRVAALAVVIGLVAGRLHHGGKCGVGRWRIATLPAEISLAREQHVAAG
jgi:hypothetical protein